MAGKGGVYSEVKSTHRLSREGTKAATLVGVLRCGHAVMVTKSHAKKVERLWCHICTRAEQRAAAPPPESKDEVVVTALDRVAAALARLDERLTAVEDAKTAPSAPPMLAAVEVEG